MQIFSAAPPVGGGATCQPCLRGLTALPGSISLVRFYLSAHTTERTNSSHTQTTKGGVEGGDGYAERREAGRAAWRSVDVSSLDGNSLESLQVQVVQVTDSQSCPRKHPEGPQRSGGFFSAMAEAGDVGFSGCLLNAPALLTQPLEGDGGRRQYPKTLSSCTTCLIFSGCCFLYGQGWTDR